MKAFGLLCLLFPAVSFANASATVAPTTTTTYTCYSYTDNRVDSTVENFEDGLLTDSPTQEKITEIVVSDKGYTIKKNELFDKDMVLTNPEMAVQSNFASNTTAMLFKKRSPNFLPYFIVLTTSQPAKPNEKPGDNPIDRMITIAQCDY